MANPALENDDEKPLDPAVEKVRRKMIRFMAFNLGLLLVALMAVVGAIVYKTRAAVPTATVTNLGLPANVAAVEGTIELPQGARILSQSLGAKQVSLHVEDADGQQAIYIFDLDSQRIVGRFKVAER